MQRQDIRPRSVLWDITEDEVPLEVDEFTEEDLLEVGRLLGARTAQFKPGDVIHLATSGNYRNDGRIVWNGRRFIDLDYDVDDYGSAPSEYTFPEYPLDHFYDSIDHNYIIHLTEAGLNYLLSYFVKGRDGISIEFDDNGKHYSIVFERDLDDDDRYTAYDAQTGQKIIRPVRPAGMTPAYFKSIVVSQNMVFQPSEVDDEDENDVKITYLW